MALHTPTLLFTCTAVLALSAVAMSVFGIAQRTYRGFWWWAAAQWLFVLGLLLHAAPLSPDDRMPLASLLTLQWPITVLVGLRRFDARERLHVPSSCDGLALALGYTLWLAAWASGDGALQDAVFSVVALVLNAYSALLLARLAAFKSSPALKALVGAEALAALGQGGSLMLADPASSLGSLPTLLAAIAMSYLSMQLSHERTEGDLRRSRRKLRYLADIDVLTRLPNRRRFHELADRMLGAPEADSTAVMMFDIDHFKHINDLLGHASGDEALRQVALAVRGSLRGNDVAGRLGGDEFGVLLPRTSVAEAMAAASRIAGLLEHRQIAPRSAPLSLSFGVVQAGIGERVDDVLRRADQALYEAKRQGRSRAVSASGDEARPVFGESRAMGLGRS